MYALTARLVTKKGVDELAVSIQKGCLELIKEADQITTRMDRLQLVEKRFGYAGVPRVVQDSNLLRKLFRV
jgi:hypothetical protein